MSVSIRTAKLDDLESVYTLINDLEGQTLDKLLFTKNYLKNLSESNIYYLVAVSDNKIIGFISLHVQHLLHHSKPICEIQELNIDPEKRGSGIGGLLIDEIEKIAISLNLEEIELSTKIHRERAQSFYRNLSYTHTHNKYVKKLQ